MSHEGVDVKKCAGMVLMSPDWQKIAVVENVGGRRSLPKGAIEKDEDAYTAALRELHEETGFPPELVQSVQPIGEYVRPRMSDLESRRKLKQMRLFLAQANEHRDLIPQAGEIKSAEWLHVGEVAWFLSHPNDQEYFCNKVLPAIEEYKAKHRLK